ncbi:UDP-N-acetylglucosamine--N-acetylmuramyl-(pentapeptide) pyrophosphoryl-undecaprenol N-acetylglucosamine transferase [Methanobacterium sp. SMA-27]|uniref:UDP-N-acetylglucosamine--N-acetylmuramyl- (pentapeptide) pyrophosphoryl-undecaprenol N-acetylglucosamine transferase n=1 Tax=Methanobacterium sp. SMA-27 TaxID=1495336 RepID=UPI00064EAEDE|nr:UDP-N-acetylglucosamine--N-acetylmuramyl-(pentapeptide) pyrophosphoryl-undecaprenol N-acetylglucosamine transferase [Methanobacterium sp. SMA-27]
MKVLIMPCGIGLGHSSRCIAIARKLEEEGVEVFFASYGSGYEMLKAFHEYETLKLPDIKFYGDGGFDIKYTVKKSIDAPYIFLKSIYHESKIIKKIRPNIIIADSHYSVPITAKILGVPCIMVTNELTINISNIYPNEKSIEYLETGLKRFFQDVCKLCKVIMIPDVPGSIEIPQKLSEIVVHTGPFLKVNPKKMHKKDYLRNKFGFKNSDLIVLVTVGGSDFGKELLNLICEASSLIECDKLIIVTGPQIKADFIQESHKVIKKEYLNNMMDWMKISDVIVSLAGHTTIMEIMSLGIPNIIIPIDNHSEQIKNTLNFQKYGISIIENIKHLSPNEIALDINDLINDKEIINRTELVKEKFSKYNGTEDAVKIIMAYSRDY